jgi:hypothetical protein
MHLALGEVVMAVDAPRSRPKPRKANTSAMALSII